MIHKSLSKKPKLGIKDFSRINNKVLVFRNEGGWGDILMHRMLFQDIKSIFPEAYVTFACPTYYHPAATNHPYIDNLVDSSSINFNDYMYKYDTTEYEVRNIKSVNKVDIWAECMGIALKNHNMHLSAPKLPQNNKPIIIICPSSAIESKSLNVKQVNKIIESLTDYEIKVLHNKHIKGLKSEVISDLTFNDLVKCIASSDFIITVDTMQLHLASGLNKKTIGMFSWTDGSLFCKYYPNTKFIQFSNPTLYNGEYLSKHFKIELLVKEVNSFFIR